ncbi:ABC transporter permease subunit [Vibrio sp. WJH972]
MILKQSPRQLKFKEGLLQAVFLAFCLFVIIGAYSSAHTNLSEMGISNGFDFLDRSTGWSYSFSMIDSSSDDPYSRTLFIGVLNTLFVGFLSIIFATILGFIVGTGRDSKNFSIQAVSTIFIQTFRNIPLILQLLFWYAILVHMPSARQALNFFDVIFISNRGLIIPTLNLSLVGVLTATGLIVVSWFILSRIRFFQPMVKWLLWLISAPIIIFAVSTTFLPQTESLVSIPHLKGLRFVGGLSISIELAAMLIAIIMYGGAYIAEIVRGGLEEVPKGLIEAGRALGLSERQIWFKISMPMALRTIIPPLGNQWIFLIKATTVGVAIGFSDLFMIVSTSITQSGQTLELIAILMGVFLIINFTLAQLVNLLNNKLKLKGH